MKSERERGEELFAERFEQIESIIRAAVARRRLSAEEGDELYSLVMLKLLRDDYAILRGFRGDSRWATYLTVIVQRALLDYRARAWGRWRPSARARQLGETAVALDRRINRDGWTPSDAVRDLATVGAGQVIELERLVARIPHRPRRRFVADDACLAALPGRERADLRVDTGLRRQAANAVSRALAVALSELPALERKLLDLRYRQGWTVRRIAIRLEIRERVLYRRFRTLLRRLRRSLEAKGLRWEQVAPALESHDVEMHVDLS